MEKYVNKANGRGDLYVSKREVAGRYRFGGARQLSVSADHYSRYLQGIK